MEIFTRVGCPVIGCRKIVSNFRGKLYRRRNNLQRVICNDVCFFIVRRFYRLMYERTLSLPDSIRTLKVVRTLALVLDTNSSVAFSPTLSITFQSTVSFWAESGEKRPEIIVNTITTERPTSRPQTTGADLKLL